jgi:hypothetical protein
MSGGRQNYAAKLLNMKASTLCTKIKQLKIRRARKTAKRKGY